MEEKRLCTRLQWAHTKKNERTFENHQRAKHKEKETDINKTKGKGKREAYGHIEKREKCSGALFRSKIYCTEFS